MTKNLYVISVELDEESVYFTEMTEKEADHMKAVLRRSPHKFSVLPIRKAPGFNRYSELVEMFLEWAVR